MTVEEVARAEELFLTGTTTDVTPIVAVDGRSVAEGVPGPIARALLDRLLERLDAPSRRAGPAAAENAIAAGR